MTLVSLFILLIATIGGAPLEAELFAHARYVPRDVSFCVQIAQGGELAGLLREKGLADVLTRSVLSDEVTDVWSSLARASKVDEAALFAQLAGRRMTLLTRQVNGERQWAVISEIEQRAFERVTIELRAQILAGRNGFALRRLPEQQLLLAHRGSLMLVGPASGSSLLSEVLKLAGGEVIPSLAEDPVLGQIQDVPSGSVNLLVRHELPMGGWTAASMTLDDGRLRVQHASRFEASPLTGAPPAKPHDLALVRAFDDCAVVSVATPVSQTDGMAATFLRLVLLDEAMENQSLRRAIGDRIIWVVGEADGRLDNPRTETVLPTVAALIGLSSDAVIDADTLRPVMEKLAATLQRTAGEIAPRTQSAKQPHGYRIDLPQVGRALLPDTPGAESFSLNWSVVDVDAGKWWIVASHPRHLADVSAALSRADAAREIESVYTVWGAASGGRVADHLRGLRPTIRGLALPDDAPRIDTSVQRLIEIADVVERVEWRLSKPTVNELRGDIIIQPRRVSTDDTSDRWPVPGPR